MKTNGEYVLQDAYKDVVHLLTEDARYLVVKPINLKTDTTVCFDDIRVYYTETSTGENIPAESVSINDGAESVEIEVNKTAALTATVGENITDTITVNVTAATPTLYFYDDFDGTLVGRV